MTIRPSHLPSSSTTLHPVVQSSLMPFRKTSHIGQEDEPSTSQETTTAQPGDSLRRNELYYDMIMRFMRLTSTARGNISKRHKIGAASEKDLSRGALKLENDFEELESRITNEVMKSMEHGSSRRSSRARNRDQARASPSASSQLSPIEVKVEDSSAPTVPPGPSHSLLSVNTTESNVEKAAKQEAQVMTRIAELRRAGLWTASRLPLCVEPPRNKTHWDYVLEEVKWMATDFRMERHFKRNIARKIAAAIQKQRRDDETDQERAHARLIRDGKRICASIAKMVRDFWQSVDKVVEHRAQEILESKKRKALDAHMAFIVGEADKLSSMVQEGLTQDRGSKTPSMTSRDDENDGDADFCASESESDDEVTIEREEATMKEHHEDIREEISALNKDADQDMDDFLASLPPEYLAALGLQLPSSNTAASSESPADSEAEDDNKTLQEIQLAAKSDKARKASEEGIEESKAKRPKIEEASDEDGNGKSNEIPAATSSVVNKNEEEDEMSVDEEDLAVVEDQSGDLEGNGDGRGMLESVDYAKLNSVNSDERQQELANIAEAALKFQPKGFTLETTQVKTAVPFLIRGTLREYQMVGLDWLVTLYEKNLNGILADEMGLGKTIQTISLLAHLACCESIWGPHLIVVPTSVILNWEMELKKWCPAFKILTYFGSQKDRAEKRKGWSKPNAFHVCITSYKTVTTDIRAFKMKSWQYLILDEAQNIKNWKSQRWQALLNVKARRRLLLTGTPLQNSLMELWSLMHFLMPAIFASHDDFKDWFSNPLTGMMDGSVEFNAPLVQQLHKVLRPFILRRLKSEVEKQLPKKTEHVIKCPLSKRQRYLYDDFMSQRSTRDNLKSGNMLSVLNIVMQLRKCCNHPNLFEPRAVQSPLCLHQLRFTCPGLVLDLDKKEFGRDLPAFFDLRKRFTGVSSATVGRPPLIEELAESNNSRPPFVEGFKLHRPIASGASTIATSHSSGELASVVDVSAAELQRAGFAQNEMVLVVRDGDDIESILGNNAGAPVPMRVRVDDGRLVLDSDGLKQQGRGAKLCQVVTGANGEKTLREVTSRAEEHPTGGNAPVPVSQVANPAPPAMAAMPNKAASTASLTSSEDSKDKTDRITYGKASNKSSVNIHPFLRCSTSVSKVVPLTVSTATTGFHHSMQNGGTHDCNEFNETIEELAARLSPPLKKRRTVPSEKHLVSGEFAELVPVEVLQRMEENNRLRLQKIIDRFECQQNPMYSVSLISLLQQAISFKVELECKDYSEVGSSTSLDIRESLMCWTEDVMKRFWIWVNPAVADAPLLCITSSGHGCYARYMNEQLSMASREFLSMAHPLTHAALVSSQLQFPELRLIEYDCGKLQALTRLLRRLYVNKHRCLIFTQMSRMLDVLQAFLSYHGYQYFRLDGTTGIEQRQALMERFNADTKIFCFILSTRSGGVGVNLTGADTVIFYDSDWNPTMDAQAQDRCHRIGQTRNVTIFRLISERTIEENILRKANQKRRLGEMAIDDAGFTPEFFKQSDNIRDLFDGAVDVSDITVTEGPKSQKDVEKAMAVLEDEQDVTAAKMLIAETRADKAEFDESKNINAGENPASAYQCQLDNEEPLDEKYIELISQLKPIERYAVNFLEAEYKPEFEEEVREAEALIEQKREDWVRAHNKAISNGEAEAAAEEDSALVDDDFYGAGLLLDEVFADDPDFFNQIMPTWTPFPTPPLSDSENDVYFDDCLDLLYDRDFMPEERLPLEIHELHSSLSKPISPVKKTPPTPVPASSTSQMSSSDAAVMSLLQQALHNPPQSFTPPPVANSPAPYSPAEFDQYMQGYNDLKSDNLPETRATKKERRATPRQLEQKGRELLRPVTPPPAVREELDYDGPEWNVIEDQALLTAIRNEDIMCHNFERTKTSLRYNWEYISGFVNRVTRFYRSPRQCSIRYQLVVRPRESGQLMVIDPLTKKPRKVPLTPAEVVHLRKGRVSTDLQYAHDADRLREASYTGRLRLLESLAARQNDFKEQRRPVDPRWLEPSGRLPAAQESRLSILGVRYASTLYPDDIVKSLEEKRIAQEAAKKKLAEQQTNNERPNSPPHPVISVCVRPPAVTAGPDVVQSRIPIVIAVPQLVHQHPPQLQSSVAQDISRGVLSQSHSPVGGMRRAGSHPQTGVPITGTLQHVQSGAPNTQHNYVVVSQDSLQPASRMQFVTRTSDGMTIGQAGQPVYRSISNSAQAKRTPPSTPSLSRLQVQGGYMANVQTVSGNSALFQAGTSTVGGPQRGRVMQRPTAPRMFVQQAPQAGDRSYVVPQQQIRMVSTQRLPPQKRTIGQKSPMTAVMVPTRSGQPHQLRAVPRGFTPQGTRIMNVVMAPSSGVPTSSSSPSLPMQATGQSGSATLMTSGAPAVRHPSPFSEATGVTVKRQLLSQSRPLGSVSRDGSPQTVAQVVIAPPHQAASEEQHPVAAPSLPQASAQAEEMPQRQSSPSHTS